MPISDVMKIFERYIFRNLFIGTAFVAVTLTFIIFLTQSLRFLEIILESNTSGGSRRRGRPTGR